MVMDNVEIEGFFHDLSLLLRDAENRNAGTDLLILKEKCQQSIRTLHFIREDRNVDPPNLDEIIQNVNIIYQEIDRALLCPNQRGIASLAVFSSGPVAGNISRPLIIIPPFYDFEYQKYLHTIFFHKFANSSIIMQFLGMLIIFRENFPGPQFYPPPLFTVSDMF